MKVYSSEQAGQDGVTYSIRYLLEPEELQWMQEAGLIPANVTEVIAMQDVADSLVAGLNLEFHRAVGGLLQ